MRKIWLTIICLVALFLNIYGIWGGLPSEERLRLIFSKKQDIKKLSQVMKETRDEIYQTMEYYGGPSHIQPMQYKVIVEGKEVKLPKWLINSIRSFLLRSNYADEQAVLASLGRMNPQKLDFNPHFFEYGGLYIYLVGASLKIASILNLLTLSQDLSYYPLHPNEMGKFFVIGRLLGALMGILAVYIIYLLTSLVYDKKTGLISALFLSIIPVVVIYSHYLKPYVFNLPFLLLSFYMAVKILSSENKSNYIWGGVFAGLAGGILIPFGLIFISILIAHLIKRIPQNPKKIWVILSLFERKIVLSLLSAIIAFIVINPYMLISLKEAINEFLFLSRRHSFNFTFEHCIYFFKTSLAQALGWPLLIVVSAGTIYSLYKREKTDILIFSFLFLAYFYISATTYRYIHYGIWIVPFLILLGARVIGVGLEGGKIIKYSTVIILSFVFAYTFLYSLSYARVFAQEDIRVRCGKWILANIEPGASIGYLRPPTPYAAPLVNPFKYKIMWWQEEKDSAKSLPQYFLYAKGCDYIPEELKPIIESQYREIKRFEKIPEILGIKFKSRESPPVILVLMRKRK
jgi:hypothetical protein